ncbi:MAG TPA: hypothetical protein VM890_17210 [Longimicrobium sp.]|nr:hypothetical protein [Longimicrobium sp.]
MATATPPFPEADLRALLAAAVAAWARKGDGGSAGDAPRRRLYVDAFAGAELQFGTGVLREPHEPTRAQAAARALDEACAGPAPCATALFVEEDPAHLQRIYGELEDAVGGERLRATRDFASLAAGEASLVEAPFVSVAAEVARFAGGGAAFFWLAPATARALPWEAVAPLLAIPGATLLIRFPHADFEKQSRHTGALADLPGFARRIVEGCSSLLADGKPAWLSAWRTDARGGTDPLPGVLERFRALLGRAAGERMVKPIALESADGARAWCFLVTSDAAVARAVDGDVEAIEVTPPEPAETPETPEAREPETPEPEPAAEVPEPEPEPPAAEVLDLFPDLTRSDVAPPAKPRGGSRASRRPRTVLDDGFFEPDE